MLMARERRKHRQDELLDRYHLPIVCFTMNIAGDVKISPKILLAFDYGADELTRYAPIHSEVFYELTGCEGYFVYSKDANELKNITIKIEDSDLIGRLFDMDVLDTNGIKLSRDIARSCIVCNEQAQACARNRTHGLEAVKSRTDDILYMFAAENLSKRAVNALIEEVRTTPKAGLVDLNNNGSHTDMNVDMFIASAKSLRPYFFQAVSLGLSGGSSLSELRAIGLNAEKAMYAATKGINTHKGANFSFLLLLYSIGRWLYDGENPFETVIKLAKAFDPPADTHGAKVRRKYGNVGVIGEAINGLTHARKAAKLLLLHQTPVDALLHIMSDLIDTNVLFRCGEGELTWLQRKADEILLLPSDVRTEGILSLDAECIDRNISAGGCADVLALALFMSKLRVLSAFI